MLPIDAKRGVGELSFKREVEGNFWRKSGENRGRRGRRRKKGDALRGRESWQRHGTNSCDISRDFKWAHSLCLDPTPDHIATHATSLVVRLQPALESGKRKKCRATRMSKLVPLEVYIQTSMSMFQCPVGRLSPTADSLALLGFCTKTQQCSVSGWN